MCEHNRNLQCTGLMILYCNPSHWWMTVVKPSRKRLRFGVLIPDIHHLILQHGNKYLALCHLEGAVWLSELVFHPIQHDMVTCKPLPQSATQHRHCVFQNLPKLKRNCLKTAQWNCKIVFRLPQSQKYQKTVNNAFHLILTLWVVNETYSQSKDWKEWTVPQLQLLRDIYNYDMLFLWKQEIWQ